MSTNEQIIKAFADQFNPPMAYVRTLAINGVKHPDAWQCTYWNTDKSIGFTVVAYQGQIHAYLEAAGRGQVATDAGQAFAIALGLLTAETPEQSNGTT